MNLAWGIKKEKKSFWQLKNADNNNDNYNNDNYKNDNTDAVKIIMIIIITIAQSVGAVEHIDFTSAEG